MRFRRIRFTDIIKNAFLYALLLLFVMPFFLMVLNSFKTTQQFVTSPFSLPETLSFGNYIDAFIKMKFIRAIVNSTIITTISVALIIVTSSMAAHLLSRNKWKINTIIYAVLVASMIVPFQAVMIPLVSISLTSRERLKVGSLILEEIK